MAKNLGCAQTIARVRNMQYFNQTRLDFRRLFYVDQIIGPELLTANDICNTITMIGSRNVVNFANGAICMRTIEVTDKWKYKNTKLNIIICL